MCIKSAIDNQFSKNQIIVIVDGYMQQSIQILNKYKQNIEVIDLGENQGMAFALNVGVMNAKNSTLFIINDDNVLPKN